jgi:hypothetical protein
VPQHVIYVGAETQVVECLVVEVDVGHKPLLKTREFLLLLLSECMEVAQLNGLIVEVERAAPPCALEVW